MTGCRWRRTPDLGIDLNLIARLADQLAGELKVDTGPSASSSRFPDEFAAIFRRPIEP